MGRTKPKLNRITGTPKPRTPPKLDRVSGTPKPRTPPKRSKPNGTTTTTTTDATTTTKKKGLAKFIEDHEKSLLALEKLGKGTAEAIEPLTRSGTGVGGSGSPLGDPGAKKKVNLSEEIVANAALDKNQDYYRKKKQMGLT